MRICPLISNVSLILGPESRTVMKYWLCAALNQADESVPGTTVNEEFLWAPVLKECDLKL